MTFEQLMPTLIADAAAALGGGIAVVSYDDPDYEDTLRAAIFDTGLVTVAAYLDSEDLDSSVSTGDINLRHSLSLALYESRSRNQTGASAYELAIMLLKSLTHGAAPGQPPVYRRGVEPVSAGPREDPEHSVYFVNLTAITRN